MADGVSCVCGVRGVLLEILPPGVTRWRGVTGTLERASRKRGVLGVTGLKSRVTFRQMLRVKQVHFWKEHIPCLPSLTRLARFEGVFGQLSSVISSVTGTL
jgi:hypothetical protein